MAGTADVTAMSVPAADVASSTSAVETSVSGSPSGSVSGVTPAAPPKMTLNVEIDPSVTRIPPDAFASEFPSFVAIGVSLDAVIATVIVSVRAGPAVSPSDKSIVMSRELAGWSLVVANVNASMTV